MTLVATLKQDAFITKVDFFEVGVGDMVQYLLLK